ncbi:MAG: DUF4402 domain-containing protein [Balneolaceae bacterium]
MKILNTISLTLLFSFVLFASQGLAQSTTVNAEGTVLAPLEVSGTNLNFGAEIFPGLDEAVAPTDAGAAQFDISGEAGKDIEATFTLPTEMTDGTNNLTLTFSGTDAGHATANTDQGTATEFDPNGTLTTALEATSGELFIWLGGTVEPAADQAAGTYTADITLDTVYVGN